MYRNVLRTWYPEPWQLEARTWKEQLETQNEKRNIPTVKPLHLLLASFMNSTDTSTVCRDYVELFSMNVNLKVFCILCLCIILCDTSKASENLTFILKQSRVFLSLFISVVWAQWRSKSQQNKLDLFQNCDVPEELPYCLVFVFLVILGCFNQI